MANNNNIRINIDGDSSGLQKALNDSEKKIDGFGKKIGGGLGDAFSKAGKGLGSFNTGLLSVGTGATLGISALGGLILKLNDVAKEMNQLSKQSGLSVEELQQLEKTFRSTGLGTEKFADINQDTLDKLADSLRNGGGIGDDLKSVGLDIQKYVKNITSKDGGIQSVIEMFYDLKKAGGTVADQKFLLESVASDTSKLAGVLDEYNNATDAMNAIHGQSVTITNDVAASFEKFNTNLSNVLPQGQKFLYEFIKPTIDELNTLYDFMNEDWDQTKLSNLLKSGFKNFVFGGDGVIPNFMRDQFNVGALEVNSAASTALGNFQSDVEGMIKDSKDAEKNRKQQEAVLKQNQALADEKAAKAADALRKKQESADKAAAAARKKAADERIKAQAVLDKAISDMTVDSNARQLAEFERQQKELVKVIQNSAKTLGLSDSQLKALLSDQLASSAGKRLQMTNDMIGYSDPNQGLNDTNNLIASGNLNDTQKSYLANQQNQRISGDNPFSSAASDQQALDQTNNTAAMNAELAQNDMLLKGHEDYEKRKAEITAKYNAQAITISNQNSQAQLAIFSDAATSLTNGMTAAFGESSGAAQAAFAISKGITMAQTVLSIQSALAQALATPFPASLAAYAQVASLGMSIISTAKGASSGQFHGGVDELPSSYDNKSFVLKAGERVIQPSANRSLIKFLDKQEQGGSTAGDITVNAPLIIQGDVAADDAKFQEMLKKHSNSVTQAIRSSQKRNS